MIRKKKFNPTKDLGTGIDKMKIPKVEWDSCHTMTNGTQSDFCSFFFFVLLISSCQEWLFSNAKKDDFTFLHL